ncbi:hypothetical protein HYH03_018360 [Edaphochlamys debaryana]|uniref:Glycosyl transferase CAP10 domain-containing protein n=1 Tax=Edaphochlamys debaryana TaxID=47281 RepID=A0A835XG28_9CHLO|nr:hypothetical protein HYH03_018360 [Edaphochlamys debaryana]|eukprot:KAG2482729.1 hypothetical protein HYH03_018360 [Edaphochlamys debaryana]
MAPLLFSNTTILKQDSPWVEFYYLQLRPYVHYIPWNTTDDLLRAIEWARTHDDEARKIAANAYEWARAHLTSLPPEVERDYPGQWPADTKWPEFITPQRWKQPPYPYLNFGGWMGPAGKAAQVMKAVSDLVSPCAMQQGRAQGCPEHDQHAAQLVLVSEPCRSPADEGAKCDLDHYAQIFYSGHPTCEGFVPHLDVADCGIE